MCVCVDMDIYVYVCLCICSFAVPIVCACKVCLMFEVRAIEIQQEIDGFGVLVAMLLR